MTLSSRLAPLTRAVLRTQSDERLVALAREGRESAFEEIVRRYRPGLVAFAAAYAPADRVEDVVQESLVGSWRALGGSSGEIRLKPWLYTIVRNRALNARRDARVHEPLPEDVDGVAQPPDIVLRREELGAVVAAVSALPTAQREALVRSSVEGHTHEQIAEAIGATPGAVRQLIYRARASVRTAAGMLIPLPVVRLLTDHGIETAAAAGSLAAGGAAIGAGGAAAGGKLAAIAAIGTLAAGAGVAIERSLDGNPGDRARMAARDSDGSADGTRSRGRAQSELAPGAVGPRGGGPGARSDASTAGGGDRDGSAGSGESSGGGARSGPSGGSGGSEREQEHEDDDHSGSGHSDDYEPEFDEDHSGPGGGSDNSGRGSTSSGSGSGDDLDDRLEEPELYDNSGTGSDSSGSGSSGSGRSGSGSGDFGSGDPAEDGT